jgi:hypothetical protein
MTERSELEIRILSEMAQRLEKTLEEECTPEVAAEVRAALGRRDPATLDLQDGALILGIAGYVFRFPLEYQPPEGHPKMN